VFEPATLESSDKHTNHYTTVATRVNVNRKLELKVVKTMPADLEIFKYR
jgi:hypothetical protein